MKYHDEKPLEYNLVLGQNYDLEIEISFRIELSS